MPNQTDFVTGLDPTGSSSITGAQLAQLVNAAYPQTDKGLVILTTDDNAGTPSVPDATGTTKWKRYLWVRQSTASVGLYIWNNNAANNIDGSGHNLLQWYPVTIAGIGAQAISTTMIADGAVTDAKIANVDGSKITGNLSVAASANLLKTSTVFAGDVGGAYGSLAITDGAVKTASIAALNVTSALIAAKNVTYDKIGSGAAAANDMIKADGAGGVSSFTPPKIVTNITESMVAGTMIKVNAGATAYDTITQAALFAQFLTKATIAATALPNAGATTNAAHGLAGAPQQVRVVLVNVTSGEAGWTVGDEFDIASVLDSNAKPAFTYYVDATKFYILCSSAAGTTNVNVMNKGTGVYTTITTRANWQFKAYLNYFA